jgi:Holliday junction resolvase
MGGMRPSTAKAKGRSTENELVEWIRSQGYDAERRRLNGSKDKGDLTIAKLPNLVVEVKSGAGPWKMTEWVRQTEAEVKNADAAVGLLAIRPARARSVAEWVGVIPASLNDDDDTVYLGSTYGWLKVRDIIARNPNHEFGMWFGKRMLRLGSLPVAWELVLQELA